MTLLGVQTPRIGLIPEYVSSAGQEAIDLAAQAGLVLDPWQKYCLINGLGERADGRWAAFECGIVVSRQNGKGGIFEARCLAGLFLFGEKLILYSAHEFKTATEMFLRMKALVDNTDAFRKRVKRIRTSHGDEGIELLDGRRLRFVARSTGSGRGFSGDVNIMDEAFNLAETSVDALMPTMSARDNPQLWYGSSAADKAIAPCEQLARVRQRGIKGDDPSLFYAEWSIDPHTKECARDGDGMVTCTDHDNPDAPESVAKANPALGIRISLEHVMRERASMGVKGYLRERLGVGNWPLSEETQWEVIPEPTWRALADDEVRDAAGEVIHHGSEAVGRVAFGIHVSPDRSSAAIATVGRRADGLYHVEVVDYRPGTQWVAARAKQLEERWRPCAWVVDAGSPAGSLIADLDAVDVDLPDGKPGRLEITKPTMQQVGHGWGQFMDAVMPEQGEPTLRYLPHPALDVAVAGAATRKLGDSKAWDSKAAAVDICPLVAATHALWGFATKGHIEEAPPVMPFAVYA
ncbi:hypothetical protein ACFWYW_55775 [Nonomuraea sp. NPDC059023]|uniref:hypothetical protein n=1 Tax=unclassified Nonomuraea TaxID=2593643 RepID=UPI003699AFDF